MLIPLAKPSRVRRRRSARSSGASWKALIGIESRVEITLGNDQTWFRVRIRPEKDQRPVETILARLEGNEAPVMMVPD